MSDDELHFGCLKLAAEYGSSVDAVRIAQSYYEFCSGLDAASAVPASKCRAEAAYEANRALFEGTIVEIPAWQDAHPAVRVNWRTVHDCPSAS